MLKFHFPLPIDNLRILTPLEKTIAGLESGKLGSPVEIATFPGKGRGVVASQKIPCGAFVTEYKTKEVYSRNQMADRISEYELNGEGCYLLEVQTPKGWFCLDATRRMGSVGRLMNHSVKPNLRPFRPLHIRGKWRVGFLAVRDIKAGEELTWDYGSPPGGHKWLCRRPAPECGPCEGLLIVLSCIQLLFLCNQFSSQ